MELLQNLSKLNVVGAVVALPQPTAVVLNEAHRFDTAFDKYINYCTEDMELFNLGPYNKRERTHGVACQGLAALHSVVEALLSWCPTYTPAKQFLSDHPTHVYFILFVLFLWPLICFLSNMMRRSVM